MSKHKKSTHGGAGRGQGRNPEGNQPKVWLKRLVQQETSDELERIRIERGLKTIGNVLDEDYKTQSALEPKEETVSNLVELQGKVMYMISMYPDINDAPYDELEVLSEQFDSMIADHPEEVANDDIRKDCTELQEFLKESIVGSLVRTLKTKYTPVTAPVDLLEKIYDKVKGAVIGEEGYGTKDLVLSLLTLRKHQENGEENKDEQSPKHF